MNEWYIFGFIASTLSTYSKISLAKELAQTDKCNLDLYDHQKFYRPHKKSSRLKESCFTALQFRWENALEMIR